jgi:hypothetical protein
VKTLHGNGTVIGIDLPESDRAKRYIVKLDENNVFNFDPCYPLRELKKINSLVEEYKNLKITETNLL